MSQGIPQSHIHTTQETSHEICWKEKKKKTGKWLPLQETSGNWAEKWTLYRVSWSVGFSRVACDGRIMWLDLGQSFEGWWDSVIRLWDKVLGLGQVRVRVFFPGPCYPTQTP